jgi:CubicO group peptidase (beta-lactamase class C family)
MGLSKDGLERFGTVAASHVGEDKVSGLVALVARGDDVHVEALGRLGLGGAPVERASLFRIASTTKPITAVATLALIREGLLELDEPVERLLPELANRRVLRRMDGPLEDTLPAEAPVTAWGLLTFTFGFGMAMEMFMAPKPWPVVAAAAQAGLATIGPPTRSCAAGSSARSACPTRAFTPRTSSDWRRPTSPPRTGWSSGTRRTGSGAGRRRSPTGAPGWCRR